jgi:hypothetical protein
MFPQCSLNVPSMFPPCSLHVPSMFPPCSLNVPSRLPQCSLIVPWVFPRCSLSVPSMSPQWNEVCYRVSRRYPLRVLPSAQVKHAIAWRRSKLRREKGITERPVSSRMWQSARHACWMSSAVTPSFSAPGIHHNPQKTKFELSVIGSVRR